MFLTFILFFTQSFAQPSVEEQMQVLESNHKNALHNKQEYEANLQIVKNNLAQIQRVLDTLDKNESKAKEHMQNSDQNKAILLKQVEDLKALIAKEEEAWKKEEEQRRRLEQHLKRVQANQEDRKRNQAAYSAKIDEIQSELADWQDQNKKLEALIRNIQEKRKLASEENMEWQTKEKSYQKYYTEWENKSKEASQQYDRYSRLAD